MDGGNTYISNSATLDLGRYREHVAHMGLDADQEKEILTTIYRMMGNFVDRAWGDDPVQHLSAVDRFQATDAPAIPAVLDSNSLDADAPKSKFATTFQQQVRGRRKERK